MSTNKITPIPQSLFDDLDLELPALDPSEQVATHSNDTQSTKKPKKNPSAKESTCAQCCSVGGSNIFARFI